MSLSIKAKLWGIATLFLLVAALNFTATSLYLNGMSADGRVVNFSGIVRGATQRLVKLELSSQPADKLITKVNGILAGLLNGSSELQLPKATDPEFISCLNQLQTSWTSLKQNIQTARQNPSTHPTLLAASEDFFKLADQTVSAAEQFSTGKVAQLKTLQATLLGTNAIIAAIVAFSLTLSISRRLTKTVSQLEQSAEQTSGVSLQLSRSSQSIAEGASSQAASLEETSASLEQMASMTQRNAENARQVKDLGSQANAAGDTAVKDMQAMQNAMQAIQTSSGDIAKIIQTIDEIAFQTNLLALNAAVEAARAGEAGAGFAVVADEVRNLAQRCAQAARETTSQIQTAIDKTRQGAEISSNVAQGLNAIVEKVRLVDQLAAEVATASLEQSQGIQQVNTAVTQMDQVTQANAAASEQSASVAEELKSQAQTLQSTLADLATLVHGSHQSPKPQAAHKTHPSPPASHKSTPAKSTRNPLPSPTARQTSPATEPTFADW
jgi:methyl-accepting chemotaxis protein